MSVHGQKNSLVAKLRVTGNALEAVSTRLNFERLFGADNFLPDGFPPKTIICIKKISDPKPQTLRLGHGDLQSSEIWRKAVSRRIEDFYRRAFRPIREAVPLQAESVVFADTAELLACLAGDWTHGKLTENWWWRGLFPDLKVQRTVSAIWLERVEFVPPAFQILAAKKELIRFVQKLQPQETKDLLKQVIKVFGLQKLEAVLFEPLEAQVKFEVERSIRSGEKKDFSFISDSPVRPEIEPVFDDLTWERRVSDLSFETQCLLEIGLLLGRSPKIVRSAGFAQRLKFYRLKNEFTNPFAGKKIESVFKPTTPAEKRAETQKAKITREIREKSNAQIGQPKQAKSEIRFFPEQGEKKDETRLEQTKIESKKIPDLSENPINQAEKSAEIKSKPPKIEFKTAKPQPPEKIAEKIESKKSEKSGKPAKPTNLDIAFEEFFEDFETSRELGFQTDFGGIFYLLNLGLYLQLYSDFTESLETEIDLNIWDFIALLGLEFSGKKIKTDAVWNFLKKMAERENDGEFAQGFDQFQDWRMPLEWLETFPKNQKWLYGKKGGRLVIRHPSGFNVVDVLLRGDFEVQLKDETENYRKYFSGITKAEKQDSSPVRSKKWLKNLVEYLQKRLFQALNLQTSGELSAILFKRKAMVSASATHLDVTFGLADLPIEVRLAGIDRDPGWIPAAGRFVYFHFV